VGRIAKSLVLLLTIGLLEECATLYVSSVRDGAKPNHVVDNNDGSAKFEFLFLSANYDAEMAAKRLKEYLDRYTRDKGPTGYDVVRANGRALDASDVAAALSIASKEAVAASEDQALVRILVEVRFIGPLRRTY
jgi:hypothetical protein